MYLCISIYLTIKCSTNFEFYLDLTIHKASGRKQGTHTLPKHLVPHCPFYHGGIIKTIENNGLTIAAQHECNQRCLVDKKLSPVFISPPWFLYT